MHIEVRYFTRSGNTKKIAEAIAEAANVTALDYTQPITGTADLLFLGSSVYAMGMDQHIKSFIEHLDPTAVKAVAVFGTSAIVKTGNSEMAKLLKAKGIKVLDQQFHCFGSFTVLHRERPNAEDLANAATFAGKAIAEIS